METQEETLKRLEEKIDAVYKSTEKSRKYLLTTLVITLVTIALPILIGALVLPAALNSIGDMYGI